MALHKQNLNYRNNQLYCIKQTGSELSIQRYKCNGLCNQYEYLVVYIYRYMINFHGNSTPTMLTKPRSTNDMLYKASKNINMESMEII